MFFWFLVCVGNVNNCRSARLPLGGHQEVSVIEERVYEGTIGREFV